MADYIERANQILKVTYPFLTNDDLEALFKISQFRVCYNKEVLIRSGQINQNSFFILKGMIRGFFINEKNLTLKKRLLKKKLENISKGKIKADYRMRFPN